MPPVGFEPTVSAGERPQTYALDRATTGTGMRQIMRAIICKFLSSSLMKYASVVYLIIFLEY